MAFANVQRKGKGANAASISIGAGDGWATPSTGNLLVVTANSDATVSITGTWTAGPSVIDGNGTYIWYRISDGTETTITCTPSVSDTICITAAEYSGNTASPFDVSNSSTIASSNGTTTTSVSVTTTATGDLIIAAACLHSGGTPQPTSPSWTNSFVNQLTAASGGVTSADVTTFYSELIAGAGGSYSTSASWTNGCGDRQELVIAFKAAATASIPYNPQRTVTTRDPGEAWWIQRDRRDANTVSTAANPLPSPLDTAWQAGGRYWHLYNDTADAAPRAAQAQQRVYYDTSLLAPAASVQPTIVRTVPPRDPGEAWWIQRRATDPQLLSTALLENELLGGADTARHSTVAATHAPRTWMPRQPDRDATTPGLLDTALLEPPLLAGDTKRQYAAADYTDRREVPLQRLYISDPSFYPSTTPTDPLTLAWGAGGTYWQLYNTAALDVDRREVPQQRRYVSDPGLLSTAQLESELLGSGDTARHFFWFTDRRQVPAQPPRLDLPQVLADPLILLGDYTRRVLTPASHVDRRQTVPQRLRLVDVSSPVPPTFKATSAPTVTAGRTSTAAVSATNTSIDAVTANRTSTPGVT